MRRLRDADFAEDSIHPSELSCEESIEGLRIVDGRGTMENILQAVTIEPLPWFERFISG